MKILKKIVMLGLAVVCIMPIGVTEISAASRVGLVNGIKNFKGTQVWDEVDGAPNLKVEISQAYKLKGEQEKFQIELSNAKWYEGRNTTLYISNAEGIEVYEGYVSVETDTMAEVVINIPRNIQEDEKIILEIPLLIKVKNGTEEVSLSIREANEEGGLVENATVVIATTSSKKMNWSVGNISTIGDGDTITPIYFEETKAGVLGTREFEVNMILKNRSLYFDEPEYIYRKENSDNIEYYLDINKYLEYNGGFKKESQQLKMTISKDGKRMTVRMQGSLPDKKGSILLKNISIRSNNKNSINEKVVITLQGNDITANNQEVTVGYFVLNKENENIEEVDEELIVDQTEEKSTVPEKIEKTSIKFKVGDTSYTINDEIYRMDGKTYIKDPGYTMVPVRYVAQAFGATDMKFEGGRVAFKYEGKDIVLTVGNTQVTIDKQIKMMQIPLQVVDGRVYAPIGEISNILEVQKDWDNKNRIAYFSK